MLCKQLAASSTLASSTTYVGFWEERRLQIDEAKVRFLDDMQRARRWSVGRL